MPYTPASRPRRGGMTNESQMETLVSGVDTSADGGAPVISYAIEINDGTGFVPVVGDPAHPLALSVIISPVESGKTYTLRYRVRNVHGYSGYSPEEQIVACTVPSKPQNVKTENQLNKLVIAWDESASTGGSNVPLTSYKFFAKDSQG